MVMPTTANAVSSPFLTSTCSENLDDVGHAGHPWQRAGADLLGACAPGHADAVDQRDQRKAHHVGRRAGEDGHRPASTAPSTFCCAAIATTIGMYIAAQKATPCDDCAQSGRRLQVLGNAQQQQHREADTPDVGLDADAAPSKVADAASPSRVQIESRATP